jgi:hypothetical protein
MRKLVFGIASIALSLATFMPSARAQADNDSVVGTWMVTVTVNTPQGAPPFVFTDLIAFNQGGTLTAASTAFNAHTSENPFLPPPLVVDTRDAYGAWKSTSDKPDRVAITFQRFLFAGAATSTTIYGSFVPGQHVGVNVVQAVGALHDRDHLAGSFATQFLDRDGNEKFSGEGTFAATRLMIEPLPPPDAGALASLFASKHPSTSNAAQQSCGLGARCSKTQHCCVGLCGTEYKCCDLPYVGQSCTLSVQCCYGSCINHRCG